MSKCREDCICLKCTLYLTGSCKYGDCKWCKGKDGIARCKYFNKKNEEVRADE